MAGRMLVTETVRGTLEGGFRKQVENRLNSSLCPSFPSPHKG